MCSSGKWVTGDIWVTGDPNLVSWNIAPGVEIFGVWGNAPSSVYLDKYWLAKTDENVWQEDLTGKRVGSTDICGHFHNKGDGIWYMEGRSWSSTLRTSWFRTQPVYLRQNVTIQIDIYYDTEIASAPMVDEATLYQNTWRSWVSNGFQIALTTGTTLDVLNPVYPYVDVPFMQYIGVGRSVPFGGKYGACSVRCNATKQVSFSNTWNWYWVILRFRFGAPTIWTYIRNMYFL